MSESTTPTSPTDPSTAGVLLSAGAAVAFGTLAISASFAYDVGADPLPLLAARFALAAALLGSFMWVSGRRFSSGRKHVIRLLLMGIFGYAFEASLFFLALQHAPAGTVSLIFYSYPLFATILAISLRTERPSPRTFAALGLGTTGVSLVFAASIDDPTGPLLALAAAIAVAIYFTLAQIVLRDVDATEAAFWTTAGAAVGTLAISAILRQGLPAAALPAATALALATSVAFVLLFAAITRIGASRAAIATMLEPITTVVLAALLLDEEITARVAIGAALVIAALPLLTAGRKQETPSPDTI